MDMDDVESSGDESSDDDDSSDDGDDGKDEAEGEDDGNTGEEPKEEKAFTAGMMKMIDYRFIFSWLWKQ